MDNNSSSDESSNYSSDESYSSDEEFYGDNGNIFFIEILNKLLFIKKNWIWGTM